MGQQSTRRKETAAVVEPTEITAEEARDALGNVLNRVEFGRERIVITRHGKQSVALVNMDDFKRLPAA